MPHPSRRGTPIRDEDKPMTENTPNNTTTAVGAQPAARSATSKGGQRVQKTEGGKTALLGIAIGLVVVVALATGLGAYAAYGYDKIYPGVTVEGIGLQGLTAQESVDKVTALLSERSPTHSFKLTVGESVFDVEVGPQDMGYDAAATADLVWNYGRQGGFMTRMGEITAALRGGHRIEPVFVLREEGVVQRAQEIARDTEQSIVEASYTFENGKLIIDRGQAGTELSAEDLGAFLVEKLKAGDFRDAVYEMSVEQPDALDLLLIKQAVDSDFQEASLDLESDPTGGTLIPAKTGVSLDLEAARRALDLSDERFVEIPVNITWPKYSTEEYQALLFRDILGSGHTQFNAALKGRSTNVLLANGLVNNTILQPGETFSYNETVGPRTYERGFKDAIVYVGTSAEDGVGGGICQVSSTMYYATLRADLEIVERRSHSRMVTYVPLGEDATVAWGVTDYKFRNNTDFPLKIVTTNTSNSITIELHGTQLVENKEVQMATTRLSHTPFQTVYVVDPTLAVGDEKTDQTGYTGYRTETWRVVYIDGVEVSRTFENKSAYTKYDKVVLHNPATPPPATDPAGPITTDPMTQPGTSEPPTETGPANNFDDHTTVPTTTTEPTTTEPATTVPATTEPTTTESAEE